MCSQTNTVNILWPIRNLTRLYPLFSPCLLWVDTPYAPRALQWVCFSELCRPMMLITLAAHAGSLQPVGGLKPAGRIDCKTQQRLPGLAPLYMWSHTDVCEAWSEKGNKKHSKHGDFSCKGVGVKMLGCGHVCTKASRSSVPFEPSTDQL